MKNCSNGTGLNEKFLAFMNETIKLLSKSVYVSQDAA
jgi:hypothetical protein